MHITPDDIQLAPEQQRLIADLAAKTNKDWQVILREALSNYVPETDDEQEPKKRIPGNGRGKIWMSPDFDEPLEEFRDYM